MATLAEALEQARTTGEMSVAALKEECDKEGTLLGTIAHDAKTMGNFAKVDSLAGENHEQKSLDFVARTQILSEAERFIRDSEMTEMALKQVENRKALNLANPPGAQEPGAPQSLPLQQIGGGNNWAPAGHQGLYKFLRPSVAELAGDNLNLRNIKSSPARAGVPVQEFIGQLKAVNVTNVMPIDTFGRVYPMMTTLLDFIQMEGYPGQQIFYQEPPLPVEAAPSTGERVPGGMIDEDDVDITSRRLNKHSIGRRTRVHIEDARAHPAVLDRASRHLMVRQRRYLMNEILNGTGGYAGTGNRWWGLLPHLTLATGDGRQTNAVPNVAAPGNEWLQYLEETMLVLWERGTMPNVLVTTHNDWAAIRRAQRAQRYQQPDYTRFPFGEFAGIPLLPTNLMPANNLLMLNTEVDNLFIEFQSDTIQIEMSDEVGFESYELALRTVVFGNIALVAPASSYKLTDTNNLNIVPLA